MVVAQHANHLAASVYFIVFVIFSFYVIVKLGLYGSILLSIAQLTRKGMEEVTVLVTEQCHPQCGSSKMYLQELPYHHHEAAARLKHPSKKPTFQPEHRLVHPC